MHALRQGGPGELIEQDIAALVGLDHEIDARNVREHWNVSCFIPVIRARNTQRRFAVAPERVAVRLALNEDDVAALSRQVEAIPAVETDLRALPPFETT